MTSVLLLVTLRALAAGALLAASSLAGFAFLPPAARPAHARERLPLSLAAGMLLVGGGVWVSGSLLGTWSTAPLLALLVALSLRRARAWLLDVRRLARELAGLVRAAPFCGLLLLAPLLLLVPQLAAPLWDSDGVRYHVAFPKLFLLTGRVFFYPWDVTGAFPQCAEMLNLLLLPLTGGEGAKLLHAGFFLAVLAALALLVHRGRATRRAALLAPFLFAAAPVVLVPAAAAFVEETALFPIAVAALLVVRRQAPLGAGIALAAAALTKLTVAPAAAGLVVAGIARAPRGRRLSTAAALVLPALVAFAPLAIRNAVRTGDPIYPVGLGLLGKPIPGVSDESLRWATRYRGGGAAPLGIHFWPEPGAVQPDEVAGAHHLLGLAALAVTLRERRLRPLLLLVLPYLALSLPFRPPTRYLVPAFLALAAVEGVALSRLARRWAAPLAAALAAPALLASAGPLLDGRALAYLTGRLPRGEFLARTVPGWRAAALVNRLPAGGRVLALDFPGPYYLDRPWIAEGVLTEPPLKTWLRDGATGRDLLAKLRALDVRYVVVTPGYGGGTEASLYPLAFSRESARSLVELRSSLRLAGRVDGIDVWAVYHPPVEGESRRGGPS